MTDHDATISAARPAGLLAGLRIRKKLMVLHTSFSLLLAVMLIVTLRPALTKVVIQGEQAQAGVLLDLVRQRADSPESSLAEREGAGRARILVGDAAEVGLNPLQAARVVETGGRLPLPGSREGAGVVELVQTGVNDRFVVVRSRNEAVRAAVNLVYILLIVSLLVGYAFVVAALEVVVLPRHVYGPISAVLHADDAVRRGDRSEELIPSGVIPADELGEIMRSRNLSIARLRSNERELADALARIEVGAADLRKKNHLLEAARRNLEGADRLASLGMMSAGIAHELNTPLVVVKGLTEKVRAGEELSQAERALLARVVGRLEKLSEGLLDFARVRPPALADSQLAQIIDEAWTLVRLDRGLVTPGGSASFTSDVASDLRLRCDSDRMIQVFVNIIRNAMGVMRDRGITPALVAVRARPVLRDAEDWVSVMVIDSGPGLDPEVIERMFEPFYSTRLDAKGTGLGLAVSEGIVREHGGVLIARNSTPDDRLNNPDLTGAVFEVLLPVDPAGLFAGIE